MGDDLPGMTLGIVGLGCTGRELARLVQPFAMRVIFFSPHADPAEARRLNVELVETLDELLYRSDFVSLHNRLTPRTRGMMGAAQFALMKPTAYFINLARGEQVDQTALVEALRSRTIAVSTGRRSSGADPAHAPAAERIADGAQFADRRRHPWAANFLTPSPPRTSAPPPAH